MFPTTIFALLICSSFGVLNTASSSSHQESSKRQCRCLPEDSCWPDDKQWQTLNVSVGGHLVIPHPTAYPCYGGPGFNATECEQILLYYDRAHFLIKKPGSMWTFNWEELGDQRCSLEGANKWNTTCQRGSVPAYAVDAHTVKDIQAALRFANQHNLRIVIKSTGHNYLGRSTAPGAILIWLHNFQGDLAIKSRFPPNGCDISHQFTGPVITVTGGKTWDEVYAKVDRDFNGKYAIVGGNCGDVGAAGGYPLGGGHGLLSPSFGLAVDNILQMSVVTADGKLLIVNGCQNSELFWALRGGGGGTFGIVTSITYKLHEVPDGFAVYSFVVTDQNSTGNLTRRQVEDVVQVLLRHSPKLDSGGWGAYYDFTKEAAFKIKFLAPAHRAVIPSVEAVKNELMKMQSRSGFLVQAFPNLLGKFEQRFSTVQEWVAWVKTLHSGKGFFKAGLRTVLGSRLIPVSASSNPSKAASALITGVQKIDFAEGFACDFDVGLGVRNKDPNQLETSVTPAWRNASWICYLFAKWNETATSAEIVAKKAALNAGLQVWRDAFPDSGSYYNEAFEDEPNWQQSFWGANYEKLKKIKREVDPNGLFMCTMCVGSEDWDKSGNCRLRSKV